MTKIIQIRSILSTLFLAVFLIANTAACAAETDSDKLKEKPQAVEFQSDLPWLNVSRPLTLDDLQGRVAILDFWTYGCINCIHVLEDLKRLEHKYGDDLLVIGVHTPKFDNEKNLETLRRIVVRYNIEHPVVNDVESRLGRIYGMRAWPTQVVINPAGQVLGQVVGENNYELLDEVIQESLDKHAAIETKTQIPVSLEKEKFDASFLAAPGKVAVSDQYVAVADTLHHRIVVSNHKGKIQKIFGSSTSGYTNGSADEAQFLSPQGLAFSGDKLYVADTGNHVIRLINLSSNEVSTIAGIGKNEIHRLGEFHATSIGLRSPWGLAIKNNQLYIAMAGQHQIWRMDLQTERIGPYAGNSREDLIDGKLKQSSFSQPSGLSLINDQLFVADAEDSAVRQIDMKKRRVKTLVGTGLFDFGDQDGKFDRAKIQHVLGIAAAGENKVYIADTYNHRIKLLDLDKLTIRSVAGTGEPGKNLGAPEKSQLNEPGGLAMLGEQLLIADTNNNRILRYDPQKQTISEWQFSE